MNAKFAKSSGHWSKARSPGLAAILLLALAACRGGPPAPMLLPMVQGTIEIDGLSAPVQIIRDRWGVPHVYAESLHDVFVGQGFVQAQDRLFQMDLWRRSAQGRLAEVLGANFIERDAMTRRLQYQGGADTDWAGHGSDSRATADAFVTGVNAWAALARAQPPELFRLAGWLPDEWAAADLLNRTDAFDRAGTLDDAENQGLPPAVVDAVRRAAVPPFFTGLASPVMRRPSQSPPLDGAGTTFDVVPTPSPIYLIHLNTPNWHAAGATPPWRPGLRVGHDAATVWERPEPRLRGVIHAEPLDGGAARVIKDTIAVKGRSEPFAYETQVTPGGVVIATDRAAARQFTLSWPGHNPGTAPAFAQRAPAPSSLSAPPSPSAPTTPVAEPPRVNPVVFRHPLAISAAASARLNVGPLPPPAAREPMFQVAWDHRVWDASRAMNAPGQAEWPESVHYSDLAGMWASGETILFVYSDAAVKANAETTLTLVPRPRR